jgi:hypothetical protein
VPFFLAILAIVFLVTAIRGTTTTLFGLIHDDFSGSGNYIYWVVSLLIIGSIGYVKKLQGISDMFLALVLIVMVIANKGFFAQFTAAIKAPQCVKGSTSSTGSAASGNTTSASGATVLGNGVTNLGTSYGQGLGTTNSNTSSLINGVTNFGTSY